MKNVYTKSTPGLRLLATEIAQNKDITFVDFTNGAFLYILTATKKGEAHKRGEVSCYRNANELERTWGMKEVSSVEFLSVLETLPDKDKKVILKDVIPGVEVEITPDGIKAGCQTYNDENINEICEWVEEKRREEVLVISGLKNLTIPAPSGIEVDGSLVSFDNFDKIIAEYNKLKTK